MMPLTDREPAAPDFSVPVQGTGPFTSVIVVSFNGRTNLERCLPSLLDQGCDDREIIVVDNASTDGTASYLENAFPTVPVVRSDVNLGFGVGCNVGARPARGEFLAFLNPDTVAEAGWLDDLVGALCDDRRAGIATARVLLLRAPDRINACGNDTHYTGLTLCRGLGVGHAALNEPSVVGAVSGAAFAIRRDVFEALGGFDPSFFLYMEDTDLSWRARLAGYTCVYVPSSVVYHDYTLRFGPEKTFFQERNRYLLLLKTFRWRTLIILAPALLLAEIATWGFVLLREKRHLMNKLRAYAWIGTHWGQVMESRRRTQALRTVCDRDLIADCTYRLAFEQTGDGCIAHVAHALFDPLFFMLWHLTLVLVRW